MQLLMVQTVSIYLEPKIWETVLDEMKQLESVWKFRKAMKKWKPAARFYRLCKRYNYKT